MLIKAGRTMSDTADLRVIQAEPAVMPTFESLPLTG
jgi:hypothetical protein